MVRIGWCVAVAALWTTVEAHDGWAQSASGSTGGATELAIEYLERINAKDLDGLAALLAPDAVFDDPTAVAFRGASLEYRGRDEIVERFAASMTDTRNAGFDVVSSFEAAGLAVLTLTYRTEIRGSVIGARAEWVPVEVSGTTVITVSDGQVTEHLDFIDYPGMLAQIDDARGVTSTTSAHGSSPWSLR